MRNFAAILRLPHVLRHSRLKLSTNRLLAVCVLVRSKWFHCLCSNPVSDCAVLGCCYLNRRKLPVSWHRRGAELRGGAEAAPDRGLVQIRAQHALSRQHLQMGERASSVLVCLVYLRGCFLVT